MDWSPAKMPIKIPSRPYKQKSEEVKNEGLPYRINSPANLNDLCSMGSSQSGRGSLSQPVIVEYNETPKETYDDFEPSSFHNPSEPADIIYSSDDEYNSNVKFGVYDNKVRFPNMKNYIPKDHYYQENQCNIQQLDFVNNGTNFDIIEIKNQLDDLRTSIKKRVTKTMENVFNDGMIELKKIDDLERVIYTNLQINPPPNIQSCLEPKAYRLKDFNFGNQLYKSSESSGFSDNEDKVMKYEEKKFKRKQAKVRKRNEKKKKMEDELERKRKLEEEEIKKRLEIEDRKRKLLEEERKRKIEEEERKRRVEEEERKRKIEEEERKRRVEEEERKRKLEEEERKRKIEEEERKRKLEEEERKRKIEEEERKRKLEEEIRKKKEIEEKRKQDEEKRKLEEEKKRKDREEQKKKEERHKKNIEAEKARQAEAERKRKLEAEENKNPKLSNSSLLTNSLLASFLQDGALISSNLESPEDIEVSNVTKGMTLMVLNYDTILFAGGQARNAFTFTISTKKIRHLPKLKRVRTYFVLALINNLPAAIGGLFPPSNVTDSVEIFENNKWKDFNSLNYGRSHSHAIQHEQITYVFGGLCGGINLTVEKFEGKWKVLDVELPFHMRNFGLGSYENNIYLFGGECMGNRSCEVFMFKTDCEKFFKCRNMIQDFSTCNSGSVIFNGTKFYLLDNEEEEVFYYNPVN
ncbi:hypothetical protein SteCoe_2393 [Stentor coeruleus]|uniref:Uncharacterized protein n=1 Tax=Stentor coeruleus TaxID=5963 RepID=A0A1R2CZQ7_9CILI|nr:hypothetical protein SteCoe_2393 [Stentor coeruleus]